MGLLRYILQTLNKSNFRQQGNEYMPKITLYDKKILINDDTKKIIEILQEAFKKQDITKEIISQDTHQKKGWWYGIVVKTVEKVLERNLEAEYVVLNPDNVELDAFVYYLIIDFRNFLDQTLLQQGLFSAQIVSSDISDKHLLIREILLRLMVYAVSSNINIRDEGDKLLQVSKDFIDGINLSDVTSQRIPLTESISETFKSLTIPNFSRKKTTIFGKELTLKIDFWFDFIKNHIEVSKVLYANKNACSRSLQFLEDIKLLTKRQLAILSLHNIPGNLYTEHDFHNEILDITFVKCMDRFKLDLQHLSLNNLEISSINELMGQQQFLRTAKLNLTNAGEDQLLEELLMARFNLLFNINSLSLILQKVQGIIIILNWFPVISGKLSFDDISRKIDKICKQAAQILNLTNVAILSDSEFEILKKYSSLNCTNKLLSEGFKSSNNLKEIGTEVMITQLLSIMGKNMKEILDLQEIMGIEVIQTKGLKTPIISDADALLGGNNRMFRSPNRRGLLSSGKNQNSKKFEDPEDILDGLLELNHIAAPGVPSSRSSDSTT
jgi:hypothetical protein